MLTSFDIKRLMYAFYSYRFFFFDIKCICIVYVVHFSSCLVFHIGFIFHANGEKKKTERLFFFLLLLPLLGSLWIMNLWKTCRHSDSRFIYIVCFVIILIILILFLSKRVVWNGYTIYTMLTDIISIIFVSNIRAVQE